MVATNPTTEQSLIAAKDVPTWIARATGGSYRPTQRTVTGWFAKGRLGRVKIGGRTFTRVDELIALTSGRGA